MALLVSLPTKWGTELPAWAIALIVLISVVWVGGCYFFEASKSRLAKVLLATLRIIIVIILLIILCEPILQITEGEVHKPAVVIMTDASLSMSFEDDYRDQKDGKSVIKMMKRPQHDGKISRIEIANHMLSQSFALPKYSKECKLDLYLFGRKLSDTSLSDNIEATEDLTDIYGNLIGAVDKTLQGLESKKISAVFLLTDGQQNTGRYGRRQAADYLVQKRIPVYPVGIGTEVTKKDIVVAGVKAKNIVLAGDKVEFKVELKNTGYQGESVKVFLKHGDIPMQDTIVTLGKENEPQEVTLYHTFTRNLYEPKEYTLSIMVRKQPKEFTGENNERQHEITVLPQKFKVLYLEQLPRWEYRYLKNSLMRDSSVESNMWLFSADPGFPQDKSHEAPTLTEPPTGEELFKYDCIILGDVDPKQLQPMMSDLVEFVKEKGGGIVFIAGPLNNPGRYFDTPMAKLLPVYENEKIEDDGEEDKLWTQEQSLSLTELGKRHEIMELLGDRKANEQLWEEKLPGYYWHFPIEKEKPGASVLAVQRGTEEKLMVTRSAGKGNTFFTAIDSSWRWRYLSGDIYFDRFWGQVIRYIAMSKLIRGGGKYFLNVDNKYCSVNDIVEIELEVRDQDFQRNVQDIRKVFYKIGDGEKRELTLNYNPETQSYRGKLSPKSKGAYTVWFQPKDGDKVSDKFQVVTPIAEMENTSLNAGELKKLAKKTKGKYLNPYEWEKFLEENFAKLTKEKKINSYVEERPIWDYTWIYLLLIALFTLEWVMRKMARML